MPRAMRSWPPRYSDYDASGNVTGGAGASIARGDVSNVGDAGFVDAAGGDFHLLPGSPLLDAGNPATPQALDLDGNPLVADGDGDGIARRDLGAFELQPAPGSGRRRSRRAARRPAGQRQPAGSSSGFTDTVALAGRAASAPLARVSARHPLPLHALRSGARHDQDPARARRTRAGAKCVRSTPAPEQCQALQRYRTIGALARNGDSGANTTKFAGRLGKRALRPGRYRAIITATDDAGNRSAPRTARFRIAAN